MPSLQTAPAKPRTRRAPQKVNAKPSAKTEVTSAREDGGNGVAEATAHPVPRDKVQAATAKRDGMITEMSDTWFQVAREGQTATLDALRRVVDIAVPLQGGEDSHRRKLIDGAFELADRAAAAPLDLARGALQSSVLVYFDVDVTVETDVDAFTGVDVGVTVPTNVLNLSL